jgi:hypothetical protein
VSQQVSVPVREVGLERSGPPACDNDSNDDNYDNHSDNDDKGACPTLHFTHPTCQARLFYIILKLSFASLHSFSHRVHTEWRWPISGVHPITLLEKSALADEGGGVHAHPLSAYYVPSRTKLQCTLLLRGQIHSLSTL